MAAGSSGSGAGAGGSGSGGGGSGSGAGASVAGGGGGAGAASSSSVPQAATRSVTAAIGIRSLRKVNARRMSVFPSLPHARTRRCCGRTPTLPHISFGYKRLVAIDRVNPAAAGGCRGTPSRPRRPWR
ncbi:MAG: hypothetical protein F4121_01370 [Acidimicrobiia bacterium]|nr:hypothetical protein [Acidimicrobiia bacterium]